MEESDLITRCKAGEGACFGDLVKPYLSMAYRTAFLIVNDRHLAQDAVQEALVEAYQSISRFQQDRGVPFRAWFYKIITYRAINLIRKPTSIKIFHSPLEAEPSPLDDLVEQEKNQRIWRAIQKLKTKHRVVIVLHYYEGFSVSQTARILGVFEGTVKSRLHKARKMIEADLHEELKNWGIQQKEVVTNESIR